MIINNFNSCSGRNILKDPIFELSQLWHPSCIDDEVSQSMDASKFVTQFPDYLFMIFR